MHTYTHPFMHTYLYLSIYIYSIFCREHAPTALQLRRRGHTAAGQPEPRARRPAGVRGGPSAAVAGAPREQHAERDGAGGLPRTRHCYSVAHLQKYARTSEEVMRIRALLSGRYNPPRGGVASQPAFPAQPPPLGGVPESPGQRPGKIF